MGLTPPEKGVTTVVIFTMEVNREDLERNDCPPPDQWEPCDAANADNMGLIYAFSSEVREAST